MEYSTVKKLLNELKENTGESAKVKIDKLIEELERSEKEDTSGSKEIPKKTIRKVADFIGKFFLKLVEYKTILWLLDEMNDIDLDL
jgi:hypothetical protein